MYCIYYKTFINSYDYIIGKDPDAPKIIGTQASVKADDVAVNIDERFPLINKEQPITINTVCTSLVIIKCTGAIFVSPVTYKIKYCFVFCLSHPTIEDIPLITCLFLYNSHTL